MLKDEYKRRCKRSSESNAVMSGELQNILIRHWLFSNLPGKIIAELSYQFSSRKYEKDQYVFHQDDPANHLFVILEGEVSIETLNIEGKVTKISYLNEHEIFGEFALIDGGGRSASALISKPSVLASMSSSIFNKLLEQYPSFSKSVLSVLVTRLRETNQQVESLVTMTLLQRTSQLLIQISGRTGPEIKTTQTELAERLFATRERVNSKLKELERMGAITTGHGKICILDVEILSKQLEFQS
jgi:CRP-like cAMP-binding protein